MPFLPCRSPEPGSRTGIQTLPTVTLLDGLSHPQQGPLGKNLTSGGLCRSGHLHGLQPRACVWLEPGSRPAGFRQLPAE